MTKAANLAAVASSTNGYANATKLQSNGVTTNALAWGSYAMVGSGSVPTIRSAYNISSITRNSAGTYTFAFTNSTTDANYTAVANPVYLVGGNLLASAVASPNSKSTSSVQMYVGYVGSSGAAATLYDYGIDFVIFGN